MQVREAEAPEPISGLHLALFPKANKDGNMGYFIMIASSRRSYQYLGISDTTVPGTPIFQKMLSSNKNRRFFELPGDTKCSMISVHSLYPLSPTVYAHLGACGVHYGAMDFAAPTIKKTAEGSVQTVLKEEPLLWQVCAVFLYIYVCACVYLCV